MAATASCASACARAGLSPAIETAARASASSLPPWRLRKILGRIEAGLDRRISLSELAALIGLSTSHFSRAFKNSVGDTPQSFIRHRRIERAKILLAETDAGLAEVAQDCGFSDQAHFTRAFHSLVGLPPRRWRASHGAPALNR